MILFSFALGLSNLAIPLAALHAGYTAAQIGLLIAVSGGAQLLVRASVPALDRRLADRYVVAMSAFLLAGSSALVVLSTALVPFMIAQLLQGAARGYFWSGSQLHAVRTNPSPLRGIARVNFLSAPGLLAGPIAAGALATRSTSAVLALSAAVALLACGAASWMTRLPIAHTRPTRENRGVSRRPGMVRSNHASVGGGAWSALMNSYVPIILAWEQPPVVVGVLVSIAYAANLMASAAIAMVPGHRLDTWLIASSIGNGLGLALVAPTAHSPVLASLALVLSGLGSGALLTLGPAMAASAVADHERAAAIAISGGFRAATLLGTPLAVAGAILLVPLPAALAVLGAALAVPVGALRRS